MSTSERYLLNVSIVIIEGREGGGGGVTIPFPTRNFSKIPVPVGFLLKIPVEVIKIPVNRYLSVEKNRFGPPYVAVCSPCRGSG